VVIGTDAATWLALREGWLSGLDAFAQRRLYARGDLDLALGFEGLFRLPGGRPALLRVTTVAIRGAKISSLISGEGPGQVICLHGLGSNKTSFFETISALTPEHTVHAIDLPGFGSSSKPALASYDAAYFARAVIGYMEAMAIDRAHLVGNSMGAAVALAAAVTHPEVTDRLVLMGPMGVHFSLKKGEGLDAVWGYTPSVANMRHLIDIFAYNPQKFPTDQLAEMRYQASIQPGAQEAFSSMFPEPRQKQVDALAAYEDRLSEVMNPTLIIHGREDRVIPLETSFKLLDVLPNAQLHVFGHCGHWTQLEPRNQFNRLVRDFLTEDLE
jgi:pimeloyl-ACP methyl ester carboxylesterase